LLLVEPLSLALDPFLRIRMPGELKLQRAGLSSIRVLLGRDEALAV
jgi:hypothetical protein